MAHEKNGYQCDFCNKIYARKVNAEQHEAACKYNPARRSCYTCKHCVKKDHTIIEKKALDDEAYEYTLKVNVCQHFDKAIFEKPYQLECDVDDRDGYGPVVPIPGSCFHWEPKEE